MIQPIAKDPNEYEKMKKLAGATKPAESSKGDKMYHYRIENNVLDTLLSKEKYEIGDPIRLYQEEGEVTQDENGEQVTKKYPKDVYGTIVNRKLVREGDIVDGATVVKIHEDEVEFEKGWTQKCDEPYLARR